MITTKSSVKNGFFNFFYAEENNSYRPSQYKARKNTRDQYMLPRIDCGQLIRLLGFGKRVIEKRFSEKLENALPQVNIKVILLCLAWYITSLVSSNLSKAILCVFPHPVFLTELQFLLNSLLCLVFICFINYFQHSRYKKSWIAINTREFPEGFIPVYLNGSFYDSIWSNFLKVNKLALTSTFPIAIFQFFGHITSYKATSLMRVSIVHSIKAFSPILTLSWYRFIKKKYFCPMTYCTLIPLLTGIVLTSSSNSFSEKSTKPNEHISASEGFSVLGLAFAAISMAIFVSQNIFSKSILTVKKRQLLPSQRDVALQLDISSHGPDKLTVLFYCSCIGFLLTFPVFVFTELFSSESVFREFSYITLCLVVIYGISHFIQATLALQLIGILSPINYSIVNIMKRIVLIGVALALESRLSPKEMLGLLMTVVGLYGYDKWGNKGLTQ